MQTYLTMPQILSSGYLCSRALIYNAFWIDRKQCLRAINY
jgi:hypothetical protein